MEESGNAGDKEDAVEEKRREGWVARRVLLHGAKISARDDASSLARLVGWQSELFGPKLHFISTSLPARKLWT